MFVAYLYDILSGSSEDARTYAHLIQCVCLRPHQSNPTSTTHTPSREVCHPIVGRAFPLARTGERWKVPYTRYYGDKILSKNLDLTQDFPNKILFHSLWEQNLVQNLPKIFRLPEMYSFGKILAQDFRMATITKILMRRENQLRRFFPWGISDKQKTENT